jgi:cytochrome c peroxidase
MSKRVKILVLPAAVLILLMGYSFAPNVPVKTKADLGRRLFNEKILSKDSSVSCASCHQPTHAFADTLPYSIGIGGKYTLRNTPSVLNMQNRPYFFWDGRAGSLEEQALMPIQNKDEMGLPIAEAIRRLNGNKEYTRLFLRIFKQKPNAKNLAAAFAAFERTLETSNAKFDDWANGDTTQWTASEERGRQLFIEKAKCFECHFQEDFTADEFRNIGLYDGVTLTDKGRFNITKKQSDLGKFKTPGLRNVALTAPYMHNGMFKTLEEVVEYYDNPSLFVKNPVNIDERLREPLQLTKEEKADLVAFMKTLSDRDYQH